jgi:hypothetical protein
MKTRGSVVRERLSMALKLFVPVVLTLKIFTERIA